MRKQLVATVAVAATAVVSIAIVSEGGAAAGGDDSVIRIVELAEVQEVIPPPRDGPVGTRYIFWHVGARHEVGVAETPLGQRAVDGSIV